MPKSTSSDLFSIEGKTTTICSRKVREILDPLHPLTKGRWGHGDKKEILPNRFSQFQTIPKIFFDPPPNSVTWGGGVMVSKKSDPTNFLSISDHFLKKLFWPKLEEENEKFLRADKPIKGNIRRPHGPKKAAEPTTGA